MLAGDQAVVARLDSVALPPVAGIVSNPSYVIPEHLQIGISLRRAVLFKRVLTNLLQADLCLRG